MGLRSRASKRAEADAAAIKRAQSDPVTIEERADASESVKGAMIDNKSMADYRKQFENHRLKNRHATDAEILVHVKEYIQKRINGIVDEACRKRIMDLTTVTLSVLSSMAIPFSGVAVVVAATVMQCLNFSVTLGLIPLLNVRSISDLTTMSSQVGNTIKRAGKSGLMAGVEASVLEILKHLGVGTWMWTEILRDILIEMLGNAASDAAWIMTPLLAAPKYMLHRHLIKKMYRKLGDKAHVVHHTWTEQNCVTTSSTQTHVVYQPAVDENGNVQGVYVQPLELNGAGASQTNAYVPQQNGGAPQAQSSQTNAYFQQQNGGAPQEAAQPNAYFQQPNGQAQVPQTNYAYFQQQATQYPQSSQSPYAANQAVPGYYPQVPMQPNPSSGNPPQGTQIMGHTAPANSSYWQPQGGVYQASAAAQSYIPQPNPTYFQQPYSTYPQPQGNPYVQMGDYSKAQVGTPGQPQFSPYGQAVQMQAPTAYPEASAPPADLRYQQQAS